MNALAPLDQADALRRLRSSSSSTGSHTRAPLVGVTGGKGGIGKSTIAANLAVALASAPGRGLAPRVLLADLDLGLASLDAILGLPTRRHLGDAIDRVADPRDLVVRGPGGVEVLPAPRGIARFASLAPHERAAVMAGVHRASIGCDAAFLDLPAGIHPDGLAFSHGCDALIVVSTPDPAALADAYAVVKLAATEAPATRLAFIANSVSGPLEARQLSERFAAVVRRFLGVRIETLGSVPRDAAIARATAARRPVVLREPASPAAAAFRLLASRVTGIVAQCRGEALSSAAG